MTERILVIVDMQNDFITGSLGTKEAQKIVPNVLKKFKNYRKENIYLTQDTHYSNYLETQEGKILPVKHCIKDSDGWKIQPEILKNIFTKNIYTKQTFASVKLAKDLSALAKNKNIEIELVGLCTDICVISNALLFKTYMPEMNISVDTACCAGSTPQIHNSAIEIMKSCQILVK